MAIHFRFLRISTTARMHAWRRVSNPITLLTEGAAMKNHNKRSAICRTGRYRNRLLVMLAVLALSSCGKSADRPIPPQSPPKPQIMTQASSSDVQRAVFSYSSKQDSQFQNGQGIKIVRQVIRT